MNSTEMIASTTSDTTTSSAPDRVDTERDSNRIVVGVDGSAASGAALAWALHQAQITGAPVEMIAAWQYPNTWGMEFAEMNDDWAGMARTTLDSMEAGSAEDASNVTKTVAQGHPAELLVEASRTASLLVVGSRGHGGFVGMLLGSTSVYVIAHAHCPVLVVRVAD